ncbi:MAG TPA: carbon storage regulator [Pirellulaceae bacterium]|jgi:carbon storage regulator CsrA|nr:carbon storage regulator [Pirellulaceae bacterium]
MLVLTRKAQEEILIGDSIRISIVRIKGNTVRLGIEAPRDVRVVRAELPPNEDDGVERTEILFGDESREAGDDNASGEVERAPRTPAMKNPQVQAVLRSMLAGSRPA